MSDEADEILRLMMGPSYEQIEAVKRGEWKPTPEQQATADFVLSLGNTQQEIIERLDPSGWPVLSGSLDAPDWDHAAPSGDWRNYVPTEIRFIWPALHWRLQALVYVLAKKKADTEAGQA